MSVVETDEKTETIDSPETVQVEPTDLEAAVEQVAPDEQVGFEETVTQINQFITATGLALGRAAHYVKPEYGEATLARLAERIDVPYETLKRFGCHLPCVEGPRLRGDVALIFRALGARHR